MSKFPSCRASGRVDLRCLLRITIVGFTVLNAIVGFTVLNDLTMHVDGAEESNIPFTPFDRSKNCLIRNSHEWLNSRRISNDEIPLAYAVNMTAKFRPFSGFTELFPYLSQSLADKNSAFIDTDFPGGLNNTESQRIHHWAVKLVFVAIQYHQHRPAIQEAELRYKDPSSTECHLQMKHHNVGNFDFECPSSKFIVGGLTANGLGSNTRGAIATLILSGLVTNRTVVLIQNGEAGPKFIRKAWKLSSCKRGDFQCVYYPLTPCIPTWEMITNAHVLHKPYHYYFGDGHVRNIPANEMDNRVWVLQKYGVTDVPPRAAIDLLHQYIRELFQAVPLESGQRDFFHRVLKYISHSGHSRQKMNSSSFSYPASANLINHATVVFAIRPNFRSRKMLDEIMREITPPAIESSSSLIGLPIRASDKCRRESECMSFADHMKAVRLVKQKLLRPNADGTRGQTILFTSESVEMTNEQKAYSMNSSDRFLVNFRDVTPNTGLINEVLNTGRFTADESMLSAISTLSFQMKARISILNCCSNFHMLLKE